MSDVVLNPGTDIVPSGWAEKVVIPWLQKNADPTELLEMNAKLAGLEAAYSMLDQDTLELAKGRRYLEVRLGEMLVPSRGGRGRKGTKLGTLSKQEATRFRKLAKRADEVVARIREARTVEEVTRDRLLRTTSYKNQPGIDATKGNVPLAGTSHLYTVNKLLWPGEVEAVLESLLLPSSLHVCCGKSRLGDVRLDLDEAHKPDIVADAADIPCADNEYDTVLCDPPYNGDHGWNHKLLAELARVASKRIIFQHWFIPAAPNGRYRKAQEKFALSDMYVWQPKTYFGRAQLVSVFDHA